MYSIPHNPGCLVVVLVLTSVFPINVVKVYLGMVTCFRARLCWGGGNVTFPGIGFPANTFISNVSMYFGATKK